MAVSQRWDVALLDDAKSCRCELLLFGVPGRLSEAKLSSADLSALL